MRFDQIQRTLALFAEGIAGHALHLQPDQPGEPSSGKHNPLLPERGAPTLLVPSEVTRFADTQHNAGVFRLSVLHQLGYREFGTTGFDIAIAAQRVTAANGFAWALPSETNETHTRPWRGMQLWRHRPPQPALERFFDVATRPALLRRVFALLEDCRIDQALSTRYPGVRADLARTFAHALAARPALTSLRPLAALFEALLQWSLGQPREALLAAIAPAHAASLRQLLDCAEPVAAPGASVYDTAQAALAICALIEARLAALPPRSAAKPKHAMLELPRDNNPQESGDAAFGDAAQHAERMDDVVEDIDSIATPDLPFRGNTGGELPMRLLTVLKDFAGGHIGASTSADDADGKLTGEFEASEPDPPVQSVSTAHAQGATLRRPALQGQRSVLYDEWNYHQQGYLKTWCRVHELRLSGDNHRFISEVRRRHRELAREIQQQFKRIRAESPQRTRGVNDGDDVDWDRLIEARINQRAGHGTDEALYVRQERAARDVAAVFLLDISASTDFPLSPRADRLPAPPAPDADDDPYLWGRVGNTALPMHPTEPPRRVIDAAKESIALMSDALHVLGDRHAIYGFSGEGRDQVEFHIAKEFGERSSARSWGALAAMQPRGATRMGAAIRHAAFKLLQERAGKRIMLIVSDGYPQDRDYGPDRKDEEYGIQDTARALQEAKRAGVASFCITIDPAGTDYLRRMCEPARYAVISDIEALPRELARVYRALA